MTLEERLLDIAETGLIIAREQKGNPDKFLILSVLLDIENILDNGQALVPDFRPEYVSETNRKMDMLREEIRSFFDSIPGSEAKAFMDSRGENLKRQFQV